MIKVIFTIADVHIPNYIGITECLAQLNDLCKDIERKATNYKYDEIRILLLGDLVHNKNNISNELMYAASSFIKKLTKIGKVVCITGNHDIVLNNMNRLDTINTIFSLSNFENAVLLDKELDFNSGLFTDENVVWCLYSIYDNYATPHPEIDKIQNPNQIYIGLFHGNIVGSTLSNGYTSEKGISREIFNGCDIVLCGDIHKRQIIKYNGIDIIYSGSVIQQNFGESVTQHGYGILKINENIIESFEFIDLENDYGYYNFEIDSIDDLDNDLEKLQNL